MAIRDPYDLLKYFKQYEDFPKKGVLYYDISPILAQPQIWRSVIEKLGCYIDKYKPDILISLEARGFLIASALSIYKDIGFIMIRKPNKLPGSLYTHCYSLEYGEDCFQVQQDVLHNTKRAMIVDDVLATGGTLNAAIELLKQANVEVLSSIFILELSKFATTRKCIVSCESLITV